MGYPDWPTEYAKGKAFYIAYLMGCGHKPDAAENEADYYRRNGYTSEMRQWHKAAEYYEQNNGGGTGTAGSAANQKLFSALDKTSDGKFKPDTVSHIAACIQAAGKASQEADPKARSYNPQAQTMFAIKNISDGSYLATTGGRTKDVLLARYFYEVDREVALKMIKPGQQLVEI
jgi:hypothetical protein